jgi:two-component system LytT family response regulator
VIRALIVDDEAPGIRALRLLLDPRPEVEVTGEARTVEQAFRLCGEGRPDVVFLDIHLRGESGFDLLSRLPEPWPRIVFVTADADYAVRAFEANALDYLLKPVEPERLARTLDRIRRDLPPPAAPGAGDSVMLKHGGCLHWVPWSGVVHVRSDGNYTHVDLADAEPVMVYKTLRDWCAIAPSAFRQVHRQHLVNLGRVTSVETSAEGRRELVLDGTLRVPVGRRFWPGLRQALAETERT